MNVKTIYKILAILLGYGLIIGAFLLFGQSLEDRIKILDIILSILVYTQLLRFAIYPLIDLDDAAQKEVGMLGIHFFVLGTYTILSLGLMVCGIVYAIPFNFQLIGQLVMVFLALTGRVSTLHSGEKVQQVYEKEHWVMEGKKSLKREMDDFLVDLSEKELNGSCIQKLQDIGEELRFLAPSANAEAKQLDAEFCRILDNLRVLTRDSGLNQEEIKAEIRHLEKILSRRKNINS